MAEEWTASNWMAIALIYVIHIVCVCVWQMNVRCMANSTCISFNIIYYAQMCQLMNILNGSFGIISDLIINIFFFKDDFLLV